MAAKFSNYTKDYWAELSLTISDFFFFKWKSECSQISVLGDKDWATVSSSL